jgi:hypothetical protein
MSRRLTAGTIDGRAYSQLDRVVPAVVDHCNSRSGQFDAIDRQPLPAVGNGRLQDGDVVDRLPIPVMHLEGLPVRRHARGKMQFVCLESQAQQ